jgi:hypothetical protein
MRVVVGVLLGLLLAVGLVVGLSAFTHYAADAATRWSQEVPPPPLSFPRRVFLKSANFVASYLIFSAPFLVAALGTAGGLLAARRR